MRRLLLVALVVLAGCGDSGPHLSKAEYTKRASAICGRYRAAIAKLGQPTKLSQIGPYITSALPELTRTVHELGALAPPSDLESQFKKFMVEARATVSRDDALRAAATAADGAKAQSLLKQAASSRWDALAKAAGLQACAGQ